MGNAWSSGGISRRRHGDRRNHPAVPPSHPPQPGMTANRYVFAAATPYPNQYPNPNPPQYPNPNPNPSQYANPGLPPSTYYQYHPPPPPPGYYPQPSMPMPLPAPYDQNHRVPHMVPAQAHANWAAHGRYPCPAMPSHAPYVEHQKAVTIRNDVNLRKETLKFVPDEENPGKFLVSFIFDATVSGSMTIIFFGKEGEKCDFTPTQESVLPSVTVQFEQALGQKFNQPPGTGIDFSMFEESELVKVGDMDVYPLVVKAEASPAEQTDSDGNAIPGAVNYQITQAVFEKDKGEYQVKVVNQILWVSGIRYELQEIYGIGNSVETESDSNDQGKECVICLSEPRDTTVLPCRHMCMCSECAKVLRFQSNRCPICRQPVERLLEIKVSSSSDAESTS